MSSKDILLLSPTNEIIKLYTDTLRENGCRLVAPRKVRSSPRKKKISSPLVIIESEANAGGKDSWAEELALFHEPIADSCAFIIVGSQKTLKEDISKINMISRLIFSNNKDSIALLDNPSNNEPSLVDLLEQKISEFVVRMKSAGGKDLYSLLIREIEKRLIKHILKESGGNQVKAAQVLGINRNTLRKKVKELKISYK